MKKIFTLMTLTAVMSSCSKDDLNLMPENENAPLKIETSVTTRLSRSTKVESGNTTVSGPVMGSSLHEGAQIGITVYNAGEETNYQSLSNDSTHNRAWTFHKAEWTAAKPFHLQQRSADIYAYFPYSAAQANMNAIDVTPGYTDFLYGKSATSVSKATPNANITLNHALAMISFTFQRTNYPGECLLNSITLNNLPSAGTMALRTGTISTTENAAGTLQVKHFTGGSYGSSLWNDITIPQTGTLGKVTTVGGTITAAPEFHALVLPAANIAAISDLNATIVIDETPYVVNLTLGNGDNNIWERAKHYTYNLTLKGAQLVVSTVNVNPWTEGGSTDIEI